MRKHYHRFVDVLQVLSAALLLLMLGVVLVGIFYRYVVDESLSWYDEFAGYILVWLTMYGSVFALARKKHIRFDTIVEGLGPRGRRVADVFGVLCVMSFSLVLLVSGWQLVREMADETAISLPQVRMAWIYGVMPISGGLMLLIGAVQLIEALGGERGQPPSRASHVEPAKTTVEGE